jgi:hypothetical protein
MSFVICNGISILITKEQAFLITSPTTHDIGDILRNKKTPNIIRRFFRELEFHSFLRAALDGLQDIGRVTWKWFSFGLDESKVYRFSVGAMTNWGKVVKLVFST